MDLAADEDEEGDDGGNVRRAGSRRIAAAAAAAQAAREAEKARLEKVARPSRAAERAAAEKAARAEKEKAEKAAEKARKAMVTAQKALRRAEKAAARSDAEKAARERAATPALPAPPASEVISQQKAGAAPGETRLPLRLPARRKGIAGPARKMSPAEKEYLAQVTRRVLEDLGVELNKGWTVQITQRKSGATSGANDKYFLPPPQPASAPEGFRTKSKYRSEGEVVEYARRLFGLGSSKKSKKRQRPAKDAAAVAAKDAKRAKKAARRSAEKAKKTEPAKKTEAEAAARRFYDATNKTWSPADTVKTKARTGGGGGAANRGEARRDDRMEEEEEEKEREVGLGDSDDDASDSESESDSSESDSSASDSESDSAEDSDRAGAVTDVRVEGMMTVMDADAKRAAFEARVLTPAKVRELEKHIDAQLAHPAMGFDVDVLQLEYQRVTGFEAVSDDAVRLREMLQDVVAKEKEKALAAAGGNKHLFSPETRRAVDAAEAAEAADAEADVSTAAAQDLEQDDVAFPDDDDEAGADAGEAPEKREPEDVADVPDEGDAFAASAAAAVATTVEAMRRASEVSRGARVPRTLGNVGVKRARELVDGETLEAEDSEEEAEEAPPPGEGAPAPEETRATGAAGFEPPTAASLVARGTRFNPTDPAMVAAAKAALHTSAAHVREVLCRERERKTVLDLVRKCLKARRGGSAYVCGLPGTGKSLTVSEAERVARCWGDGSAAGGGSKHAVPKSDRPRVAAVNCMALGDPRLVFSKVIEELGGAEKSAAHKNARAFAERDDVDLGADLGALPEVATLRQLVTGGGVDAPNDGSSSKSVPTTVILLDEMDQLVSKAQGILYELFGLPTLPGSRCVVIGVANGINLVEVTLPRLAARAAASRTWCASTPTTTRSSSGSSGRGWARCPSPSSKTPASSCARAKSPPPPGTCAARSTYAPSPWTSARAKPRISLSARRTTRNAVPQKRKRNAGSVPQKQTGTALLRRSGKSRARGARRLGVVFLADGGHRARLAPAPADGALRGGARVPRAPERIRNRKRAIRGKHAGRPERQVHRAVQGSRHPRRHAREFSGVCTVLADQTLLRVGAGREDRQRKVSLAVHQDDVVFALQGVNFFRNLIGEGRGGNAGTSYVRGGGEARGG